MGNMKRGTIQDDKGVSRADDEGNRTDETEAERARRTAGTNRDFDESGESKNQGHSHAREPRERASEGADEGARGARQQGRGEGGA